MIFGGMIFATMCRDKQGLQTAIYSYMAGSLWLSVFLFLTTYGTLQRATASNYHEASQVREEASELMGLGGNLNSLAFLTTQGGVVAVALALAARSALQRGIFVGISLFCLVGSFLLMSRTGLVVTAGGCSTVLMTYRAKRMRALVLAMILLAAIVSWVPDVVFLRMDVTVEGGRSRTYKATLETLPDYFLTGVGAGHFWSRWNFTSAFQGLGAHNVYLQVTINWGLPALVALLGLIFQAYRCIPKRCDNDGLALCLPGLAISCLLMMLFSHTFYDKWYSFALGLVVAAQYWIWPTGIVPSALRKSNHPHALTLIS
jgi:O-antigen ligase